MHADKDPVGGQTSCMRGTNILKGNKEPERGQEKHKAAFLAPCLPDSSFNAKGTAHVITRSDQASTFFSSYNWHFPICYFDGMSVRTLLYPV